MKRKFSKSKIIFFFLITILLILIGGNLFLLLSRTEQPNIEIPYINQIDSTQEVFLLSKLKSMTIDEKRGLLFMVSIPDKVLSKTTIKFLKENYIGGVVLLGNNVETETQIKQLTKDLREKVNENLLIAIDQEGGTVVRIPWDKYSNLSARDIGLTNDNNFAYEVARYRAELLLDLGINVILGPVADIAYTKNSFMYDRSFGSDPETVAKFVEAFVKGQNDAGIITVLKHFPGHGRTTTDSHKDFPVIHLSKEELLAGEFIPFKRGIEAGAEMIMLAHIVNPLIDPDIPASVSFEYVEILERELGFFRIVITDDLDMTGKIDTEIGWGINLVAEKFESIKSRIEDTNPDEIML